MVFKRQYYFQCGYARLFYKLCTFRLEINVAFDSILHIEAQSIFCFSFSKICQSNAHGLFKHVQKKNSQLPGMCHILIFQFGYSLYVMYSDILMV